MNKRDLIIIAMASSGFGHMQAAQNLLCAFRASQPNLDVKIINIYDFMGATQRHVVEKGWKYFSLIPGLREVYGISHRLFIGSAVLSRWLQQRFIELAKRIEPHIDVESLRHYVALHPAAVPVGAHLKKSTGCQLSVVATDFVFHNIHCHSMVDRYMVDPQSEYIGSLPVTAHQNGRVYSVGIPIAKEFRTLHERHTKVINYCDSFQILVSFGACGYRGLRNLPLIRELILRTAPQVRFVIVTGHNKKFLSAARTALNNCGADERVEIYGFEGNMPALMAKSHLLIGKAGGLTVSEAFSAGLPMIVLDILPGQEAYNARVIQNTGAGICTRRMVRIIKYIEKLRQPGHHVALRNLISELGRTGSSDQIASLVLAASAEVAETSATGEINSLDTLVSIG